MGIVDCSGWNLAYLPVFYTTQRLLARTLILDHNMFLKLNLTEDDWPGLVHLSVNHNPINCSYINDLKKWIKNVYSDCAKTTVTDLPDDTTVPQLTDVMTYVSNDTVQNVSTIVIGLSTKMPGKDWENVSATTMLNTIVSHSKDTTTSHSNVISTVSEDMTTRGGDNPNVHMGIITFSSIIAVLTIVAFITSCSWLLIRCYKLVVNACDYTGIKMKKIHITAKCNQQLYD
jgi:hypothetical protein